MLQLYNTLTKNKETFTPISPKKVHIYVCGITPYDTTHLGHAFTYISFDVLIKYLTYKEYDVTYAQNVTDINDRDNDILKRASEQGTTWEKLSEFWTKRFLEDMAALNWTRPNHYLFASKEVASMIHLIQKILDNDYAYQANGGVYLDITKYQGYGKLSHLTYDQMVTLSKDFEEDVDNTDKRNPLDITLWRPTHPNQAAHIPSFDSPFGKGRPGWHIECSAMALNSLGKKQTESDDVFQTIDIHGGGIDLIYPHHESEITQSETATGIVPFAKYWMHVNLVQKDHEKMSKSKGNLVLISDLLRTYSPNAIRWYLLSHHYRDSWNFEEKELQDAEATVSKLTNILKPVSHKTTPLEKDILHHFENAMDDDLNTPKVLEQIKNYLLKIALLPEEKKSLSIIANVLGFVL